MVLREKITVELNSIDAIYLFNVAKACARKGPSFTRAVFNRIAEALRAGIAQSDAGLDTPVVEAVETIARLTPWQN